VVDASGGGGGCRIVADRQSGHGHGRGLLPLLNLDSAHGTFEISRFTWKGAASVPLLPVSIPVVWDSVYETLATTRKAVVRRH
jgi:hypothetical protein